MSKRRSKSLGVLPPAAFRKAMAAPAGKTLDILRQYDPLIGTLRAGDKSALFKITVRREVTRIEEAVVEIDALDAQHAKTVIGGLDGDGFDWRLEDEEIAFWPRFPDGEDIEFEVIGVEKADDR